MRVRRVTGTVLLALTSLVGVASAAETTADRTVYIGFTDLRNVWATVVSPLAITPVQGPYGDPFTRSQSDATNPFNPFLTSEDGVNVTVSVRWRRVDRRITVSVLRRPTVDGAIEMTQNFLGEYPVGNLHLLLIGATANDNIQIHTLEGSVTVHPDGAHFLRCIHQCTLFCFVFIPPPKPLPLIACCPPSDGSTDTTVYTYGARDLARHNMAASAGTRVLTADGSAYVCSGVAVGSALVQLPLVQEGVLDTPLRDVAITYNGFGGTDNRAGLGVSDAINQYVGGSKSLAQLDVTFGVLGGAYTSLGTQGTANDRQQRFNVSAKSMSVPT